MIKLGLEDLFAVNVIANIRLHDALKKNLGTESASNPTVDIPWKFIDLVTWKSLNLNCYVFLVNCNIVQSHELLIYKIFFPYLYALDRSMLFHILQIKLIANKWAWESFLWKRVVVSSKMWASSRVHSYPPQPREQKPPPGTETLRNSVEILINHYTNQCQQRRREGGPTGVTCHTKAKSEAHKYLLLNVPECQYTSARAWRKPVCQIGMNEPGSLLRPVLALV